MNQIQGQRWAVTGAGGEIGHALREHLASHDVDLVSIDVGEITPVSASDHVVGLDVRDLAGLEAALADCAGVVHLGGLPDEADFHDLADVNIVGTYHVLEAARRVGIPRVIYASTNRVTGFYPTDTLVDESMPVRPDGFYAASKVAGEALCRLYADKFSLSTIIIRIATYEQAPQTAWQARTWLSPADGLRAFDAAMTTPQHHTTFYALSDNTGRWWSLDAAREAGFVPVDNGADHADRLEQDLAPYPQRDTEQLQGGPFTSVKFSLDEMRTD